jgi:glycosyltransferase involved in cell wall biosynthesis
MMANVAKETVQKELKIAICSPEWELMQQALLGGPADATYIIQKGVVEGLLARGHAITNISPSGLNDLVCTPDPQKSVMASGTWSTSGWFHLASKITWRLQDGLKIPYLNVFSNFRRYDACVQCLPGHDIVYERNGIYNAGVALACKQLKLPYVLFVEADEILEHDYMGKPLTGLLRWRAKRIFYNNLHTADCIICVSDQLKKHLISNWDVPSERIITFPNAVDTERFRPYTETRIETRASLDLDNNPLIIFVGNFYEWHDVTTLLDSFAQVLVTYPEARLILVGDGEQRAKMEQHVDVLGIRQAVQFTGFVSHTEIPHLMSTADIAVAPYPRLDHELWLSPLKLYEYMASGTVVVASEGGQIMDVIENGRNGLLVPPEDPLALADALKKLIDDPVLRSQLGKQAREDAVQKHSWQQYLTRLERLFAALVSRKPISAI